MCSFGNTTAEVTTGLLFAGFAQDIREAFSLVPDILALVRSQAWPSLGLALLVGAVSAAAGWVGAVYFARLWNRRYRLRRWQHVLCAAAALLTLVAAPVWAATGYVQSTARAVSRLWQERLVGDEGWQEQAYINAYGAVKRLGAEDFTGVPAPGQSGSRIPLTDSASVRAVAGVYNRRMVDYIAEEYPHLSAFIRETRAGHATSRRAWAPLVASGALRPARQVASAGVHLLDPVLLWTWRVRLTTGGLVFAAHLLVFGVVGALAARDIRVHT